MKSKQFRNDLDRDVISPPAADRAMAAREEGDVASAAVRSSQQIEAVQMERRRVVDLEPEAVKQEAAAGTAGSGGSLPYLDRIQSSFGAQHDLSGVQAHSGQGASRAADSMGAAAYTAGESVAFGAQPDLRLAAHEAAHVVQQRAGVRPGDGGVGKVGDEHERAADQVADRVVAGQPAGDLLPDAGAGAQADAGAVQHYVEDNINGEYARAAEDKKAVVLGQENFSQHLYASDDHIAEANNKLKASGEEGSYIRLVPTGETLQYHELTLKRVAPVFNPKGDQKNEELEDANKSKDEDDVMSLWADCGRSSRVVMGSKGDAPPHAEYREGATDKQTGDSYGPAAYSDRIYLDVMPDFLGEADAKQYLVEGVHYRNGDKASTIRPSDATEARAQYWQLGEDGRRAFDKYAGINTAANPDVGGGYTMATEYDMPGFQGGRSTWNFHWAGVVMKAGSDNITLENYADGRGYDSVNVDWNFQMYGTIKKGQTFQEEHLASNTHGNRASTFAVKPKE